MKTCLLLCLVVVCLSLDRKRHPKHPQKRTKAKIFDDFNLMPDLEHSRILVKDVCFLVECKMIQEYSCDCLVDQCIHQDQLFIKDEKIFKQQCSIQDILAFDLDHCYHLVRTARITHGAVGTWQVDQKVLEDFKRKVFKSPQTFSRYRKKRHV